MIKTTVALFIAAIVNLTPAVATQGSITVADGWARVSSGPNSAIFMHMYNDGKTDDALVSAASNIAETTELHTHIKEGDVYKMRPVPHMLVNAGEKTTLKPGGLHIMLLNIKRPINEGDKVPVTLTFKSGQVIHVDLPTKKKQCMCHESRVKKD